jgi:hypothetical protein
MGNILARMVGFLGLNMGLWNPLQQMQVTQATQTLASLGVNSCIENTFETKIY